MKKNLILVLAAMMAHGAAAQVISTTRGMKAVPKTDNTVSYNLSDAGEYLPLEWGMDLAWMDERNFRCGIQSAGQDIIDVVRASFRPSDSNADGTLSASQQTYLNRRANYIKNYCKPGVLVNINDDHGEVGSTYMCNSIVPTSVNTCAAEWAKCIDVHRLAYQALGINVESASPVNENDYNYHGQISTNESIRRSVAKKICEYLYNEYGYKELGINLCGGNTLNCDRASEYWNDAKAYLSQGNTHQLAGGFNKYAAFFQEVKNAGQMPVNDELHNVMEAMVGVQYGLKRGIWWGTAEHTRSQFMKASNKGVRLAYSENRNKWTAASVYRHDDGTVEGFIGASERQATTTTYRFFSQDRDVWYDGQGPMREFVMTVEADPSGAYASDLQKNREDLVNIQTGEDIQPVINGTYKIANKGNISYAISSGGTLTSFAYGGSWSVTPHERDLAGDIRYHRIQIPGTNPMYLDVENWGLSVGTRVIGYRGGYGSNEQWYLRYAGDGYFYIMSRHNGLCLQPRSLSSNAVLEVAVLTGADNQKWRFLPASLTTVSSTAPIVGKEFAVTDQPGSVLLTWNFPKNRKGYITADYSFNVLRRVKGETEWQLLAQGLTSTSFTDNTALPGTVYEYGIRTRFISTGIKSATMEGPLEGSVTEEKDLLARWCTGDSILDATQNGNHPGFYGTETYGAGPKDGLKALSLNGSSFVQLPSTIASHEGLTVAAWVYWTGGSNWQRVFDFGSGESQYMFLTPSNGSQMRLAMKNGGTEKVVSTSALTQNTWVHVTATVDADGAKLYVNGEEVASGTTGIVPSDFNPVFNYIGRSQFASDPMFRGSVSDVRVYNFAADAEEVRVIYEGGEPTSVRIVGALPESAPADVTDAPAYDLAGRRALRTQKGYVITSGKKYLNR